MQFVCFLMRRLIFWIENEKRTNIKRQVPDAFSDLLSHFCFMPSIVVFVPVPTIFIRHICLFIHFVGKFSFRIKQITETILSNAREIKPVDGAKLTQYGAPVTKYEKYGGQRQAFRDYNLFRTEDRQNFLLPGGVCPCL